ncbi:MAG: hypothetical protein US83_C0001G0019 [Candidatus Falkowbacteria bacterium GW2011_GWC2_38_22]|uniref:PEGA domain-containing protein n=1 Tax=Candidatus Falkowbacteria bacterium GW2011_GWE1_38_31 TaxID=1618638 RepID=A0A0G0K636_9BACT|nr:MAG: hypothetical protein US73_C0004G0109 [Candidatus Falkowbacteria bacterium GW2011_GWF2_38_1205]KKQ62085.1 MAG: hypothetical protein US83_C0001G0019 [Candidatus Falkowbacteria bacterium GW2011_GWC2_38_22]KKQ64235.1 MAG: hypothetical protein US84_C0001G0019 [Candidatus Falkowbacteria bacterium GW2011_GWF1_38_22]KKQ66212.1 MAG: hypothetical protein US87_C0002G0019 [Candidatus Falkowbacteria bacterium GW2011_GWE2_38_254]KKQ70940.1 MAG: hypothetical protein US91_C0002G0019 [Candidatus Falkowb
MSLSTRRTLYIFFIIIFFTITPLIMLYAAGYSLADGLKVQKTGILIADTEPEGATIVIDGKTQKNLFNKIFNIDGKIITTPAKVKNLIPGEYTITLSKDKYWDWQKKLSIKPGESTYIENVSLFKKDTPLLMSTGTYEKNAFSPNKEYLAFSSQTEIVLIDAESGTQAPYSLVSTTTPLSAINDLLWSPNSKNLIYGNRLFSVKDWQNPIDLSKIIGNNITDFSWDNDNDYIYYLSNSTLHRFNIATQSSQEVKQNLDSKKYIINDNLLHYLQNEKNAANITTWDIDGNKQTASISLPVSDYVLTGNKKYLNLYDRSHHILYLLDPFSAYKPIRESITNVDFFEWINDNKLLFANQYEIWIFDLEHRKNTLLTRISQEIKAAIWHPSDNYIIYATDKDIFTIELDDREKYNITKIIELETIKNPILNKKGDTLYFYSKIGNQEGMYKLTIQ